MSTSDQLTSTSKDTSSTAWGNQLSASAYLGWETHGGALFTPKVDISTQLDVSTKVGKDYEDNYSSYNSSYQSRTVDSTASTARDDYLKARLQLLDIWRYRVYGAELDDPNGQYLYYDVILPGPYDSLVATGGGLTFPWYQPLHENGNILSYPGLASLRNPSDLGSYQIPCPAAAEAWDGASPQCAKCNLDKDAAVQPVGHQDPGDALDYPGTARLGRRARNPHLQVFGRERLGRGAQLLGEDEQQPDRQGDRERQDQVG